MGFDLRGLARVISRPVRRCPARLLSLAVLVSALIAAPGCASVRTADPMGSAGASAPIARPAEPSAPASASMPAWDGEHPASDITGLIGILDPTEAPSLPEVYPELDRLGRCGACTAVVSPGTMPTEEREGIGMVKPSGWQTARYDGRVDGNYLYNRCHLIGYQLTGENANERNLVTGTRYLNVEGMLPYENMVADHVERTGGRVLYRVEPLFEGDELVCRGVIMQALSLDDGGKLTFSVWCPNVQPGIEIDYTDGSSSLAGDGGAVAPESNVTYVVNKRSGRFHRPECPSIASMSELNRQETSESRSDLEARRPSLGLPPGPATGRPGALMRFLASSGRPPPTAPRSRAVRARRPVPGPGPSVRTPSVAPQPPHDIPANLASGSIGGDAGASRRAAPS